MRLLRRACTNLRTRRRSTPPAIAPSRAPRPRGGSPISRDAATPSVRKHFHALTLDPRQRGMMNRVLHRANDATHIEELFKQADKDHDGLLTQQEFRAVFASRFSLQTIRSSARNTSLAPPTRQQLKLVMVASAIPFVGFGFVDNIIMLAAGDMIEDHFHAAYHISMLCAAALGNTVADVVGLSLGGLIETFARRIGIPDPALSKAQANMAITHWCNFVASAGGITLGCLLGMFPLLFMNYNESESDEDAGSKREAGKGGDQVLATTMQAGGGFTVGLDISLA